MNKKIIIIIFCCFYFSIITFGKSDSLTGKLYMVGNVPFNRLVCETAEKQQIVLSGKFLDELNNLQGATVKITGIAQNNLEIKVETYQLLAVGDGENQRTPWVGVIKSQEQRLYLKLLTGEIYEMNGPLVARLKKYPGAKIWVTGSLKRPLRLFGKYVLMPDAFQIIKKADKP